MNDDGQRALSGRISEVILLGAHLTFTEHKLEVGRVEGQVEVNAIALGSDLIAVVAKVVLHVARAEVLRALEVIFEFFEDVPTSFAEDVGEDVETTPMGHADRSLLVLGVGGGLQESVEHRNERLALRH